MNMNKYDMEAERIEKEKAQAYAYARMQGLNLYNYFSPAGRGARTQRPTRVQHIKAGNKVKIIKHY